MLLSHRHTNTNANTKKREKCIIFIPYGSRFENKITRILFLISNCIHFNKIFWFESNHLGQRTLISPEKCRTLDAFRTRRKSLNCKQSVELIDQTQSYFYYLLNAPKMMMDGNSIIVSFMKIKMPISKCNDNDKCTEVYARSSNT